VLNVSSARTYLVVQNHREAPMNSPFAAATSSDPLWDNIRQAAVAAIAEEPIMASLVYAGVLNQSCFEGAMNFILAERLGSEHMPAALLRRVFDNAIAESGEIGAAPRADLVAICERDPACKSPLEALLFFKGFHAIQTYRYAHRLLQQDRRTLAQCLQSRSALVFGIDINRRHASAAAS
jgi:serine O-acetyltransferase